MNVNMNTNIKQPSIQDLAFSRLLPYIRMHWCDYQIGRHHKVIAQALEMAERGEIRRLAIFTPPRYGKTMLASEFFASWYLGRNPDKKIIFVSYSQDRADDVGKVVRNHLLTDLHKEIFPNCQISSDSKAVRKFTTTQKGNYFAVGAGGVLTGRGANCLILDDLIKDRTDAQSVINNRKRIEWFTSTAYTRLMPGKNLIVLIMTRWSYDDIATFLLEDLKHENWYIINLPAIATEDNDIIGRKIGDPLWEEMYPKENLELIRKSIGSLDWNSLYQQQPLPAEGGMINLTHFKKYPFLEINAWIKMNKINSTVKKTFTSGIPTFKKIVISIDTAFKQNELSDPSAFTIWGVSKTDYVLIEVVNKKLEFPELKKECIRLHKKYYKWNLGSPLMLIEDKASGQSLIQELKRFTNIPVVPIKAENSKEIRMAEVTSLIEGGKVWLPERADWLSFTETQFAQFPLGKHDDISDSMSQFLRWTHKPRFTRARFGKFWK